MVLTFLYFLEMKHWTNLQDHLFVLVSLLPEDLKGTCKTESYYLLKVTDHLALKVEHQICNPGADGSILQ